jgi:hypothetical protein
MTCSMPHSDAAGFLTRTLTMFFDAGGRLLMNTCDAARGMSQSAVGALTGARTPEKPRQEKGL